MSTELLGHSGDFALFGDGAHDGLTVIVNVTTLDTFDPQPFAGMDPTRWDEPDEALAPTEAWELAETVLANTKPVTGTDVIIAAGDGDKRSFAIPKAVQVEAQKALKWRKEYKRGGTDVGLNTARTLARGGSIGIQKVRHCNRYFARHEVDKSGTGWSPGDDGYPSNGRIAFSLWGGDAAWKWTNGILRREKDLAALAADDADAPPAPAEVTDAAAEAPVPELDDEQEFTADELDGIEYAPDQPHPYLPDHRMGYLCEVCLGSESSLLHVSESETPIAAAGSPATSDIRLEQIPNRTVAKAVGASNRMVNAGQFYGADLDSDDVPDFYLGLELRADGMPSMVTAIFMRRGDDWLEWSPGSQSWGGAADQSEDVVPVDDESAYAAALLMASTKTGAIPASELNPPEWAMADEARSAIPDYELAAFDELDFCVVFGDSVCKDCDELTVEELYLRTEDGECWRWNPVDVEWQQASSCPSECTGIDADAAREIALRLMKEAHAGLDKKTNQGTFKPQPGGGDKAIGPSVNRPHGPTVRPPNRSSSPFEFDSAFGRAAWVRGTQGDSKGYMSPTATATSFASLVEQYASLVAAGETSPQPWHQKYTPEERAKNASKQFRDAKGRFSRSGDTVHVEGGRTGKVKDYDEKTDRVKVQYDDNSEQDVARDQVTRLGRDEAQAPAERQKIDVSKIKAEPRAVATTPKAMLPKMLPPMDVDALKLVISNYQEFIERERKRKLETYAALTPETTDVRPLYLAQVDPVDNQAVLELIALVPKTEKTTDLRAFVRRNGRWELDAKMLGRIKSVTPPALVVLDEGTYDEVREQVDSFYKEKSAKGEEVASILHSVTASARSSLWTDDGTLLPVAALESLDSLSALEPDSEIMTALMAAGIPGVADTPSDIAAARRLRRYWLRGPGAAKIMWNTPGDWTRCVKHLMKYMGPRARGYCQVLHKDATGVYTGSKFNVGNKRGLRGDGSALLLSMPTKVLAAPGDVEADGITSFEALAELEMPTVEDMKHLSYRDEGHVLRVGERFLVKGNDGVYALRVLDPAQTLGWGGEPAIICGTTLLREKKVATTA